MKNFITTDEKSKGITKRITIERAIDWDGYVVKIEKANEEVFYRPAYGKNVLLSVLKQEIFSGK